jgi:hypothetical protein
MVPELAYPWPPWPVFEIGRNQKKIGAELEVVPPHGRAGQGGMLQVK